MSDTKEIEKFRKWCDDARQILGKGIKGKSKVMEQQINSVGRTCGAEGGTRTRRSDLNSQSSSATPTRSRMPRRWGVSRPRRAAAMILRSTLTR